MAENINPHEDPTRDASDITDNLNEAETPFSDATSDADFDAETNMFDLSADEKLKIELAEMKDKYIRLYADFENFRRRTARERLELVGTATTDLMQNILPIVDDFERAMQSFEATSEVEPLREGVSLIFQKLYKTLESKGLKVMKTVGLPFDADFQESVAQYPAPNPELKGMVIDEVEKGYLLNDKVIRYAKVVVGGWGSETH